MTGTQLSIVIPVLNEAASIEATLTPLQALRQNGVEILLCDGGSTDDTVQIAEPLVDRVWRSEKGRANQMNAGAMIASGEYLLFLHADTQLPGSFTNDWSSAMRGSPKWGFFTVQLSGRHWLLRLVERFMNWRSQLTSVATGDQVLFIKRSLFESCNGYAAIPLMEDVELCKRLRRVSKPGVIHSSVITSSRRWEQRGILATIVLMWRLRLAYFLGASPQQLVDQYYPRASEE